MIRICKRNDCKNVKKKLKKRLDWKRFKINKKNKKNSARKMK